MQEPGVIYTHYNKHHMIYKMGQYRHTWIQEIFNMYIKGKTKTYHLGWFQVGSTRHILFMLESFIPITECFWDTRSVGGGGH